MRERIINKLENNAIEAITEEEIYYVLGNRELLNEIMKKYSEKKEYWNRGTLFKDILDFIFESNETGEVTERFFYLGLLNTENIEFGVYVLDIIEEYFDNNSVYRKKCLDFFYSNIENRKNLENADFNDKILRYLIENERFDSISKIKNVRTFSADTADLLLKSYPFSKYGIPQFLDTFKKMFGLSLGIETMDINSKGIIKMVCNLDLKYFSNESLLGIFSYRIYEKMEDSDIRKIIIEITNRMQTNLKYFNNRLQKNPFVIDNLYQYMYDHNDEYGDILFHLFKNNVFYFASFNLERSNYDHVIDKILGNSDNDDILLSSLVPPNNKFLKKDKKMIDSLIAHGKLNFILQYISAILANYYTEKIVTEIENGNPNFDEDINNLPVNIIKRPIILKAILKTNKIYNFSFLEKWHPNYSAMGGIIDDMKNYMLNSNLGIVYPRNTDLSFILEILVAKNKNKEVIEWFASSKRLYSTPLIVNKVISILKDNPEYLDIMINSMNETKFAFLSAEILTFCLNDERYNKRRLLDYAIHHEECDFFFTKDICIKLKDFIVSEYNFNEHNYIYFIENIGPHVLKFLNSENISKLLKLDFDTFKKICNLFMKKKYTIRDLEAAHDSLVQYEFSQYNQNIVNIFSNIVHYLENGVDIALPDGTGFYVNDLLNYMDDDFINNFLTKYQMPKGIGLKENILKFILEKIKYSENNTKYKNILHEITDYYIRKKREEYRAHADMYDDMGITYKYNKKSLINCTIKYFLKNPNYLNFYWMQNKTIYNCLVHFFEKYGFTKDDFNSFLMLSNNSDINNTSLSSKKISEMRKVLYEFFEVNCDQIYFTDQININFPIKRDYNIESNYDDEKIYIMICDLQLESMINGIISDDDVYESLLNIMNKRKIHILPIIINNFISTANLNLEFSNSDIAAFISNYHRILKNEQSIQNALGRTGILSVPSLTNIIKNSIVYGYNYNYFGLILNQEDANHLKKNSGPNAATLKLLNNQRLKEAVDLTKANYLRSKVTVPTFNEILFSENKSMRVIVGNFTHPSNLTHGERTGACMRIGGVGESLFNFVLKNPNGFHIRFEDSETNEYISRVSGFRNGNTVFLNELRYSLNPKKYSDLDVVEFCRLAAMELIELSKDSEFPIENVVIHNDYAMQNANLPITDLNVINIKEGLPYFYSDVNSNAIVLATSSKNDLFVPVTLGISNLPEYLPAREQVFYSEKLDDIVNIINRVHAINIVLNSTESEYEVEGLDFSSGYIKGYASMDWYAYIDENGNIKSEIITIDKRAQHELNDALTKLEIDKKMNL